MFMQATDALPLSGGPMPSRPFSEQEIIARSRRGVLRGEADAVARLVGLADKDMAGALGLSASYFHRLHADQYLSREASERLSLLENLLQHALDTFEGRAATVLAWLRTPIRELDQQTPLQTLDTVTGYTLADRVLGRIDHGIFG
jgi:putative toxin-antitoxin system antitoxin component (TIGR02293 family)